MDWFLKKRDGQIYGPVTGAALQQWAAGGRIAADDEISSDQVTWHHAADVADLGLDWMVEMGNGTLYGPFHLLALGDLIREGSVPAAAPIIHRVTGERHILHEALLLVMLEQNTRLAATAQELRVELEKAQAELDELAIAPAEMTAPPGASGQAEWKDMAGKRDSFEKEAQKWKRLYTDAQAAAQTREAALNERIEHLRREDLAARTQLEQTQLSLRKLEKTLEQIGDTTVYHNDAEAAAGQRLALLDAYNELSRRCETLMDQLNAKSAELEELLQTQGLIRNEADQRVQAMEAHLRKERDEADRARKRALQLEEDHLQLLRSFRDLNDRYIRLRQQASHVPSAENPWPPPADVVKKKKLPDF
ncbi:MAG: hypothetical protein EPN23_03190 [Verrucomicrobia bacterium]|nr:MAG: hypothetical protein EPN23_03190 [Verrucomicrobiota bacterium]